MERIGVDGIRSGDVNTVQRGCLTFLNEVLLIDEVRRMDNQVEFVNTIESVLMRQQTVVVNTGLGEGTSVPLIREVDRVGLTDGLFLFEQVRRVYNQVEVTDTVTTALRNTGALVITLDSQYTTIAVGVGLLVGDVYGIPTFKGRMNADYVLEDRVATYERRNGVVEDGICLECITLVDEDVTEAECNVAFAVVSIVHREVQRLDNARRVGPSDWQRVVTGSVVLVSTPYERQFVGTDNSGCIDVERFENREDQLVCIGTLTSVSLTMLIYT